MYKSIDTITDLKIPEVLKISEPVSIQNRVSGGIPMYYRRNFIVVQTTKGQSKFEN